MFCFSNFFNLSWCLKSNRSTKNIRSYKCEKVAVADFLAYCIHFGHPEKVCPNSSFNRPVAATLSLLFIVMVVFVHWAGHRVLCSTVVQIVHLFFILTMAKVEATSFGSRSMISSKKILTGLGYVRIFSKGA